MDIVVQRVVILGNSGSGKSTLAWRLGERLGLPRLHLDTFYYLPGWKPDVHERFQARVGQAVMADRWVVDGNFLSSVGDVVLPRADLIIWLHQPRWRCLLRAAWRCVAPPDHDRADLPAGCRDILDAPLLTFLWRYERITRPENLAHIARWAPETPLIHLKGDRDTARFLAQTPQVS